MDRIIRKLVILIDYYKEFSFCKNVLDKMGFCCDYMGILSFSLYIICIYFCSRNEMSIKVKVFLL